MLQSSIFGNSVRRNVAYLLAGLTLVMLMVGVGSVSAQSIDGTPEWGSAGSWDGSCYGGGGTGVDPWDDLFGKNDLPVTNGETYIVSFTATGTGNMTVNVGLQDAPHTPFGQQAYTLNGSVTDSFEAEITAAGGTNLTFQVGGAGGATGVCVSNVTLTLGELPPSTPEPTVETDVPEGGAGTGGDNMCSVSVRYDNAWDGGVVANIAIFNNTHATIEDWELTMDWPDASGASIDTSNPDNYWVTDGTALTVSGSTVSAKFEAGTENIEHNDIRSFGFVITDGSLTPFSAKPTNIMVNGMDCTPPNPTNHPGQNAGGTLPILNDDEGHWSMDALDAAAEGNECVRRFKLLYNDIHNRDFAYFDEEGIPYHTVEELNVEAPDYGHVTTSEAFSYMLLVEAAYGKITGDWSNLEKAWAILEHTIIADAQQQPTWANHTAQMDAGEQVASYAPELVNPADGSDPITTPGGVDYPSTINLEAEEGVDPIYKELNAHWNGGEANSGPVYTMHWLLDVDNTFQFGDGSRGNANSVFINTFQRGGQEATWETLPHPSYEEDEGDVLNEFGTVDGGDGAPQWRYTNAPDADGRALEALRYAELWGAPAGQLDPLLTKGAKMADYLRYDMFDKYFVPIGCEDNVGGLVDGPSACTTGNSATGDGTYSGAHDMLAWYSSWGAPIDSTQEWSFLIGSSDVHMGYQEPWAAYVIKEHDTFDAMSPEGKTQWSNSFKRQMDLYVWLQPDKDGTQPNGDVLPAGFFAGGVTNSVNGQYQNSSVPASASKFCGMAYDPNPVYHDPGSNTWFGFQVWSGQRYMYTVLEMAEANDTGGDYPAYLDAADDWAAAAIASTLFDYNGQPFAIPSGIDWHDDVNAPLSTVTEMPAMDFCDGDTNMLTDQNTNLSVDIGSYSQDVGVGGSLARTLLTYAQIDGAAHAEEAAETAMKLMDTMWAYGYTVDDYGTRGMALSEYRGDYLRWWNPTSIDGEYTMGNDVTLTGDSTFDEIHWFYAEMCDVAEADGGIDPNDKTHSGCIQYCEIMDSWEDINDDGSPDQRAPKMVYHRFWGNADNIMALIEADEFGYTCGAMPQELTTSNDDVPLGAQSLINSSGPGSNYPAICESYTQIGDPEPLELDLANFDGTGITPPPLAVVTNDISITGSAYVAVAMLVAVMGAMTVGFVVRND